MSKTCFAIVLHSLRSVCLLIPTFSLNFSPIAEHRSINQTLSLQHAAHSGKLNMLCGMSECSKVNFLILLPTEYSNTRADTLIRQNMCLFNQSFSQTPVI